MDTKWYAVIAVVLLVAAAAGGYYWYTTQQKSEERKEIFVEPEDKVAVDYIGRFVDLSVFDTSMYSVAIDNVSYPKSPAFSMREPSAYVPLKVKVGTAAEGDYITVIEGFREALIGMKVGDKRTAIIPPEKGYGFKDPALIVEKNLIETIPMKYEWNESKFTDYYGKSPMDGLVLKDPKWGWNVTVFATYGNKVVFHFTPQVGETVSPFGWEIKVLSVDSTANNGNGEIKIQHLIKPSQVNRIHAKDFQFRDFYLIGLNPEKGTFTIDYNEQIKGNTLIFTITLLNITKNA
ncbi:MAG: FKBP-type peptidyl-prolyl cis-trans isomerase [Thermoplasmata archaeon]|nr:FKBP-type peptidyl-prolyl cis-trans isomerase [Thermoplasmata archaeon]